MIKKLLGFGKKKESEAINKFRSENDVLITYAQLEDIPINEMIQIVPDLEGAIECTRISSNKEDSLMFTVTMKQNQLWEKHHHDCFEKILIFKGTLTDIVTGNSVRPAQMLTFNAYQPHYVVAEEDSVFYVEFEKPKK